MLSRRCFEFINTSKTKLSEQNAEQILRAAVLMKVAELTRFCVDYTWSLILFIQYCRSPIWSTNEDIGSDINGTITKTITVIM